MPQRNHACINSPCSHLCLLSKNNTFTCACPVNMKLKFNKRDCIKSEQSFSLIFGVGNYVVSSPHQVFGRLSAQESMNIGKYTVDKIEYNSIKESIFVADNRLKVIVEFNLRSKMSTELVDKDISFVSSMSFGNILLLIFFFAFINYQNSSFRLSCKQSLLE
jgi:low-density lipoprotein receptor-related protein 1 (alpha-2-macroglobulin receptor)